MPTLILKQHSHRVNQQLLRRAVKETLCAQGIRPRGVEVSILLTDDESMRALNARYRGIDRPTDVLSFSQENDIAMPGTPKLLGDIVISVDTAISQAKTSGRSLDDEISQLAIHGTLHLLGHDDATTEGYKAMVREGEEIWERIRNSYSSANP